MSSGLLARIASGDPGAVEEFLTRYSDLIWALARRFSTNRSEAEDVVQEICLDLWRSASRFNDQLASEKTFVTMIARRRLIDFRRKRQRSISTTELSPDVIWTDATAADLIAVGEESELVRALLAELLPIERTVIEMAIDEGLTQVQIAKSLDIPLGTVKTTARRGLNHLRELIRQSQSRKFAKNGG